VKPADVSKSQSKRHSRLQRSKQQYFKFSVTNNAVVIVCGFDKVEPLRQFDLPELDLYTTTRSHLLLVQFRNFNGASLTDNNNQQDVN
jgi:hypothetical protein